MSYLGVQPGSRSVRTVSSYTADGSTSVFNVSGGYVKGFVDVFVNGIKYKETSDFTATDNLTITILTTPLNGDTVEVVAYSPLAIYSVVSKAGDSMTGDLTVPNLISSSNVSGANGYFTNIKINSNAVVNSSLTVTGNTTQVGNYTLTGNLNLTGSLVITGAATSVSTQSLSVQDSIIVMASNNTTDTLDIGFAGRYNNGSANIYAGIIRNATDKEFYVFDSYDTVPGNDIDITSATFKIANLHANFNGNVQSNSISVVTLNATNGNFTSSITLTGDASGYRQNTTTVYGGDAGAGYGRFEYYNNAWVLNAGTNSSNVAVFRRGSSDKSWIDNNGAFTGPIVLSGTLTANGGVGSANQVLTSNGTGAYWAAATAGATVSGTNTMIQFNDSGSLGGVANLTFDKSTNRLSIGNSTVNTAHTANGIIVAGDTGVVPASNTVGTTLGTATARWVVTANTGDFTGTITGVSANMSTSVNSALLSVGTSFIANTTGAYHTGTVNAASHTVGSSFIANTTAIVGTGYANISTSVNSALLTVGTSFIANTTGAYHTGVINAASHTVGTSFIANTTGAYHTGVINAASHTVGTNFIANSTQLTISGTPLSANGTTGTTGQALLSNGTSGSPYWATIVTSTPAAYVQNTDSRTLSGNLVISGTYFNPSANTILLGNSISRWVVSANTGDFTGTITGTSANMSTSVNSALLTVGTSFIANTTGTYHTGTVNAASLTVGSSFIANTTGTYHTGTVNAASHTVGTNFIANTTGTYHTGTVNAASHTVGTNFIANTTGTYHTGTVNAASHTVGTSFIANTAQVTISGIPLSANGGVGTAGQALLSNGATGSPYWGGITALTANSATYLSSTGQLNLIVGLTSAGTDVNTNNDGGSFSARGNTTTVASMSFHRAGAYAINMGLGTDNVFRIGGWSASVNAFQMDGSGNLTMLNNVTAYSDERKKKNWRELPDDFIEKLAVVKHGIYDRTDTDITQVGVSAQSLQEVMEHAVLENTNGELSVAYGNAALAACVQLAKRIIELEEKLKKLTS